MSTTFPKLQSKLNALSPILRGRVPSYNEELKSDYLRLGKAALVELAKALGVDTKCVQVNPAGIAVAGDITLHTDSTYLQISDSTFWGIGHYGRAVLIRSCAGQKDYTGGPNQYLRIDEFLRADELVASFKRAGMKLAA